jgi:N-methylhydantoinase A
MLLSDLKHDFVRTYHSLFSKETMDLSKFFSLLEDMEQEGERVLSAENIPPERRTFHFSMDLRYLGQYHEVNVPVPAEDIKAFNEQAMKQAFHSHHDRLYGYSLKEEGREVELVNLRMTAAGVTEKPAFRKDAFRGTDPSGCLKGGRPIFIPSAGEYMPVEVYDGDKMGYGNAVKGPAIIEQVNTTIFVPPGYEVECDEYGSYLLTLV